MLRKCIFCLLRSLIIYLSKRIKKYLLKMSENTDDLEQTLVLAAAAADLRQYEEENAKNCPDSSNSTPEEIHYYTETENSKSCSKNVETSNSSLPDIGSISSSLSQNLVQKRKYDESVSTQHSGNQPEVKHRDATYTGTKRLHADITSSSEAGSHAQVVATHYNLIEEKGIDARSKSRIIHMMNFHNWIKSMLINEYLTKIRDAKKQHNAPVKVMDLCCGKGGDLLKWKIGNINYLICSDIAEESLEHCKQRYADMKQKSQKGRIVNNIFSMEVIHGDCGKVRLREKYSDPSLKLDLVSCQFAFHYGFESLPQAECFMKNASECLQPGGYFIGTMVDSNEIIARARKSESGSFGNDVFEVTLDFDLDKPPLFGGKYHFKLEDRVDCPEFLVHFPTFVKLAKKYGLKLVRKEKFHDFFQRMKDEGRQLLSNMRALEVYPPFETGSLKGNAPYDYTHAKEFIEKQESDNVKIGTLTKSEWEASTLYLTYVFEKVKNTWNTDGTPCYDI